MAHEPQHLDRDEGVRKVAELIKDVRIAMLTTVDPSGALVSRPMAVQDVDFDGDLWFFTEADSHKTDEVRGGGPANAAFAGSTHWVSVSGTAEVVRDQAKIEELWGPAAEAWFPDGPTTPGVALIKLEAESAEYWESPGGRLATAISLVKAKVRGERYDGGENAEVDLS
ncbi:pyridoxamine 5'-phosphate oxidase [Cellulomonas sp. JZ18]|uniref:pyridoxamine 5'-phosphate oxidase family protein n=1 Tax=Cellulomonas sp. JZ18 TaxID=2654191 RepID=UPI0012D4783A|nr:pyridoxamine 5'-phosphate oxidase family protein [Cellulomonas sp. JZ18]QGQ18413.1 pyridoxamine 5'-phosphate oxidase [Cellulomonas sp. JZ18]